MTAAGSGTILTRISRLRLSVLYRHATSLFSVVVHGVDSSAGGVPTIGDAIVVVVAHAPVLRQNQRGAVTGRRTFGG
jgi:hypothetical protein